MQVAYAIAEEFNVPNETIVFGQFISGTLWFRLWDGGPEFTCKLNKRQDRVLKNSFRRA